jgi:putative acetyltransferase
LVRSEISFQIVHAEGARHLSLVRVLLAEYASSLGFDLGFQDFERELAHLPGEYAPPGGALLLALHEGQPAGCVALRALDGKACEMKRLYVRPPLRGSGMGRALTHAVVREAKGIGYLRMRLDTVPSMEAARVLYASMGFAEIAPYRYNPIVGATYLELSLVSSDNVPTST